jgi:methionyl-tRNA formyltransferase
MRILFIGCVAGSEKFLRRLIAEKKEIVGVVTKSESKFNADFVDLGKNVCEEYGIDYIYVKNVNDPDSVAFIREKKPDLNLC